MNTEQFLEQFLADLAAEGKPKPATLKWYRDRVKAFVAWLGDKPPDRYNLRAYLLHLQGRKLSEATYHGHIRALKRFSRWLVEEGYASENPARGIKLPRLTNDEPKGISEDDFQKMCLAAEDSRRDIAILMFLCDTGCRAAELLGLRWDKVDLRGHTAQVVGKFDKKRTVYYQSVAATALSVWRDERGGGEWVFTNHVGGQMSYDGLRALLERLAARAGVIGPHNAHSFRHAFARDYLLNNGDLASLAKLMGHSSLQTTMRYSCFLPDELQEKHRRHSPLSGLRGSGQLAMQLKVV